MEEIFFIDPNDKGISITLKREANIILASLDKDSDEYLYKKERFEETLSVIKAIENTEPQNDDDVNFIINTINTIWNNGILSPLTLNKDEFLNYAVFDVFRNRRYKYIYTYDNDKIYNAKACNLFVRAIYDVSINSQIVSEKYILKENVVNPFPTPIYISKGGVITGDYIDRYRIREDIVQKHSFTIQSIVNVPVAKIIDGDITIYVVDHREPKLKVLKEFYDIPIYYDETIADRHYNIRKYKKLDY